MKKNITRIKFNSKRLIAVIEAEGVQRMGEAVEFLRGEVIKSLNRSQPTRRSPSGKRTGLSPSRPGEAPKRVDGDLVRSIHTTVERKENQIRGSYGSTLNNRAKALEFGTSRMKARPFLRPPLLRNPKRILRILTR